MGAAWGSLWQRFWPIVKPAPLTWIVPDRLAACTYPRTETDWQRLQAAGITDLLNLHGRPHASQALADRGLQAWHLPVRDFRPPDPDQLREALTVIRDALAAGRRVAVHCQAGLGRTGTVLACYLVQTGMPAEEALAHLRRLRPGSVETRRQEQAVIAFAASFGD